MGPLHEQLWQQNRDLAEACWRHPFVRGLADGSLVPAAFQRYIAQDAFFLRAFAQAYAVGLAKSREVEVAGMFRDLLNATYQELRLHGAYAQELGMDLSATQPYRATSAYTDFLLATAWHSSRAEIVAAMTPCMRLYLYLGSELAKTSSALHPYRRWIATYSGDEFRVAAGEVESLLDRLANDQPPVRQAYRYAMQCELDFFSAPLEAQA